MAQTYCKACHTHPLIAFVPEEVADGVCKETTHDQDACKGEVKQSVCPGHA